MSRLRGSIVKEVTACGDQKRGSQLLWGKGWFTLLFSEGKCTVWMLEMYNNACIVSVHRSQSQQLDSLQGIILHRFTQVCTSRESPHQRGVKHIDYWVIHTRLCLHGTPQQMTEGLMMGPQHKSQWLTAVLKQGNRGLAKEVNNYASYHGFMMSNPKPCGHRSAMAYEQVQRNWQERSTW